jgi:hypothetical protein
VDLFFESSAPHDARAPAGAPLPRSVLALTQYQALHPPIEDLGGHEERLTGVNARIEPAGSAARASAPLPPAAQVRRMVKWLGE